MICCLNNSRKWSVKRLTTDYNQQLLTTSVKYVALQKKYQMTVFNHPIVPSVTSLSVVDTNGITTDRFV
jgi:alpha-galactosidase